MTNEADILRFGEYCRSAINEIGKDIVGQKDVVENVVTAMIVGGNVLLEGVPGTGKTRLIRSVGQTFGLSFSRIQFTPDMMPADVTGVQVLEKKADGTAAFRFSPGPVFANIVLADEINRATPKTQSALLQAMEEHRVSVGGTDHMLEEPFFVLATQNPIEQEGTYPLPEAQMDRFMFKLIMRYPTVEELTRIVALTHETKEERAQQVLDAAKVLQMRRTAASIPVIPQVTDYAMRIVAATQPGTSESSAAAKRWIRMGASPRAAQALMLTARIRALINGRLNVSYDDINALAHPVLCHRIKPGFDAVADGMTPDMLIDEVISEIKRHKHG